MFNKAVAIHATVMVVLIAFFLFITLVIFWHWMNLQNIEANKLACGTKLLNFCANWFKNGFDEKPYNWGDVEPKNCDKVGILEPTADECKLQVLKS